MSKQTHKSYIALIPELSQNKDSGFSWILSFAAKKKKKTLPFCNFCVWEVYEAWQVSKIPWPEIMLLFLPSDSLRRNGKEHDLLWLLLRKWKLLGIFPKTNSTHVTWTGDIQTIHDTHTQSHTCCCVSKFDIDFEYICNFAANWYLFLRNGLA